MHLLRETLVKVTPRYIWIHLILLADANKPRHESNRDIKGAMPPQRLAASAASALPLSCPQGASATHASSHAKFGNTCWSMSCHASGQPELVDFSGPATSGRSLGWPWLAPPCESRHTEIFPKVATSRKLQPSRHYGSFARTNA